MDISEINLHKNIGLVLSGGGARGYVHIGVIRALSEYGIEANIISGSSMGSIVGLCYAAGLDFSLLYDWFDEVEIPSILQKPRLRKNSILSFDKLEDFIKTNVPYSRLEDLPKKFYVSVTNILNGKNIIYDHGDIISIIKSSCCLPMLFSPIEYQDQILIDGGITDNFPVGPLLGSCDFVIGSHANKYKQTHSKPSQKTVLLRSINLLINNSATKQKHLVDLYIEPPTEKFGILDFTKYQDIIHTGYIYTHKLLEK